MTKMNQTENSANSTPLSALMDLKGRTALVTGAAGHIGIIIAETLLELGASVLLLDRHEDALASAQNKLFKTFQGNVQTLHIDLEDEAERSSIPEILETSGNGISILVNNAAFVGDTKIDGWNASFQHQSLEAWRRAMEVNLTSVFHLCQILAPALAKSNKGSILNVASMYGVIGPNPSLYDGTSINSPAGYSASKGGIISLSRWLATHLAPEIRVNCISPGGIYRHQDSKFVDRYIERTPLARMGKEEDLKGAIAYFSSDQSNWVTGQNLSIDGGFTVW